MNKFTSYKVNGILFNIFDDFSHQSDKKAVYYLAETVRRSGLFTRIIDNIRKFEFPAVLTNKTK